MKIETFLLLLENWMSFDIFFVGKIENEMNLTTESIIIVKIITNSEKSRFVYDDKIFEPLPLIDGSILVIIIITSIIVIGSILFCIR